MLTAERTVDNRVIRLSVIHTKDGWETRTEKDDTVVRVAHYSDWHRVERCIQMFDSLGATCASSSSSPRR